MDYTWKDELERMAAEVQQEAERHNVGQEVFDPPRGLTARVIYQDGYIARIEKRLARSERWADIAVAALAVSMAVNIFQLWN
jgi:hypothetical protein